LHAGTSISNKVVKGLTPRSAFAMAAAERRVSAARASSLFHIHGGKVIRQVFYFDRERTLVAPSC